jgi:hypothetical protein
VAGTQAIQDEFTATFQVHEADRARAEFLPIAFFQGRTRQHYILMVCIPLLDGGVQG